MGPDSFTRRPDGKLVFRGAFPDKESVFAWLLPFGDRAELLAPAELRQDLARLTRQLAPAGTIRSRKMFGEYGLYCDEVFFAVVCDDQLFIKCTPQGEEALPRLPKAPPYEGAKDSFLIEDIEDRALLTALTQLTCQALGKKKGRR